MARKINKTATDPRHPDRLVDVFQSTDTTDEVEAAGEDSFPASDPPSHTPVTATGKPSKSRKPQDGAGLGK